MHSGAVGGSCVLPIGSCHNIYTSTYIAFRAIYDFFNRNNNNKKCDARTLATGESRMCSITFTSLMEMLEQQQQKPSTNAGCLEFFLLFLIAKNAVAIWTSNDFLFSTPWSGENFEPFTVVSCVWILMESKWIEIESQVGRNTWNENSGCRWWRWWRRSHQIDTLYSPLNWPSNENVVSAAGAAAAAWG